jgi:hypothetical protein
MSAYQARQRSADAERARVYRARQRAEGKSDTRKREGRGNQHPTRWKTGQFVALDGEGFSEGELWQVTPATSDDSYIGRTHYYAYLAASDGSDVYAERGRLSMEQCLDFVCQIKENNPDAIIVAFGASYDINQMVAHEIDKNQVKALLGKHPMTKFLNIEVGAYHYRLEYRARKCLTIKRWSVGEQRYQVNAKGARELTPHLSVQVWDVWGFFQGSFVEVMEKWLPQDADYTFIKTMKGERSTFDRSEIDLIRTYNAAELRCLVKIMDNVRAAINDLGLKITRWDGAGAIAAAMMQKYGVKKMIADVPPEVFDAARLAYSGGHIEVCKVGYHKGEVHHYDINSAYPNIFRQLPALSLGFWRYGSGAPPKGFTLCEIRFEFRDGEHFYPLFFRSRNGAIIYPRKGRGVYWYPEYEAAKAFADKLGAVTFEVVRWWHFDCDMRDRPFSWVEEIYTARQKYIEEARALGRESGPEKIIKLGCNSLYGKTAQQVGARYNADGELQTPPYFNLCWAGYVTAGCRAMLMQAAIQRPEAIISFATDGLFSTKPLDVYAPDKKELGAWEYRVHTGITMVMPGVYWLHDGEEIKHYSRGFNKKEMKDVEIVHAAWRQKKPSIPITVERLIGMGTACISPDFWKMRGCFVKSPRRLAMNGENSKRYAIDLNRHRPHTGLVDTTPKQHMFEDNLDIDSLMSAPYPISWLDGDLTNEELEGSLDEEREMIDAELA